MKPIHSADYLMRVLDNYAHYYDHLTVLEPDNPVWRQAKTECERAASSLRATLDGATHPLLAVTPPPP